MRVVWRRNVSLDTSLVWMTAVSRQLSASPVAPLCHGYDRHRDSLPLCSLGLTTSLDATHAGSQESLWKSLETTVEQKYIFRVEVQKHVKPIDKRVIGFIYILINQSAVKHFNPITSASMNAFIFRVHTQHLNMTKQLSK